MKKINLAGVLASMLFSSACDPVSTTTVAGGIGGSGISWGTIAAFGSVYVNGVRYETDSANIIVEDAAGTQSDLHIGMYIKVSGSYEGLEGVATAIEYEDSIEGPVSGLTTDSDGFVKTFSVLGNTIIANSTGTVFDSTFSGFSFDTLSNDDLVEVSGFSTGAHSFSATFIKKVGVLNLGTSVVEVTGTVSNANTNSFTLDALTINFSGSTDLDDVPGGTINNGMFVEVEGVLSNTTTIEASRIEEEASSLAEDDESLSVEGVISNFVDITNFQIQGMQVDAGSATIVPAAGMLLDGVEVEVQGEVQNGILVAEQVEIEDGADSDGEIKIHANVSSVDVPGNSFSVQLGNGAVTLLIDSKTQFEDETEIADPMSLVDLNVGDFIEMSGYVSAGDNKAKEIHRKNNDEIVLRAPIDSFNTGNSVTALGVTFFTDGSTVFEDSNDMTINSADFYAAVNIGDNIQIKDAQPGDGTADEAELDD